MMKLYYKALVMEVIRYTVMLIIKTPTLPELVLKKLGLVVFLTMI